MILFYTKNDGNIFATIDGRVHSGVVLNASISYPNTEDSNIGKYIIGWIEDENGRIEYNLDKFELLQEFEGITPESPLMYRVDIETGQLIKK